MNLVKVIVDTLGVPLANEQLEELLLAGDGTQTAMQLRLHTGVGPQEAAEQVRGMQVALVQKRLAVSRAKGIRTYSQIYGCSLSKAKQAIDSVPSDD